MTLCGVSSSMTIDPALEPINLQRIGREVGGGEVVSVLFEEVYERHMGDVFRYALILTRDRDDAEDVASETFARALRAWRKGSEPDGPPLPWLLAITRNIATDGWHRARRVFSRPPEPTAPSDTARLEAVLWLHSVAGILPERQREVIALRYHRELTDADIGAMMGLSESGVRSLVARAIKTLRMHPEVWR
jgi:RNA polymerase sigma-70 factor, ECF subfamily